MFNVALGLISLWGGCLLPNKCQQGNMILLLSLLTVWLQTLTHGLLYYLLSSTVLLAFKTKSYLLFYIFYEMSVIPIFLIIFLYGYQPEKLQASLSLILYTVISSLPLLYTIIVFDWYYTSVFALPLTLAFIVKTPLYLFHSWLPKAHVEAPLGGSMFLAGVLLKLGTYGLMIFTPFIIMNRIFCFYIVMSVLGAIISSLICLRQADLKKMIAYSSIVHMSVATLGIMSGTEMGMICVSTMLISHGLASPLLFMFAYNLYKTSHSRMIVNNGSSTPMMSGILFGLVTLNMSVPPSLGIWAEIFMAVSFLQFNWGLLFVLPMFFVSVTYNLYLYVSCMHTKYNHFFSMDLWIFMQVMFLGYTSVLSLDFFV